MGLATYSGDSMYSGSTATTNLTVTKATTPFTASATPPSVAYGTSSTLAESGLPGGATGTVTFASGTTTLCTATLPATSCSTSTTLRAGSYAVTVTYSGDSNYASSTATTNLTVTPAATTTTVTSSQNPAAPNQSITYAAQVSPNPGSSSVTFTDNGVAIGGCTAVPIDPTTGKATCSTTYPGAGTHTISAAFNGNANYQVSSAPTSGVDALTETVQPAVGVPVTGSSGPASLAGLFGGVLGGLGVLSLIGAAFMQRDSYLEGEK